MPFEVRRCINPAQPRCGPNGLCVPCISQNDNCPFDQYCTNADQCSVGCKSSNECAQLAAADGGTAGDILCDTSKHQCVECLQQTDCPTGKLCSPSGACVDGCDVSAGSLCPGAQMCCSNLCIDTNDDIASPKPSGNSSDESANASADKSDDKSADKDKKKEEKSGDDQAKIDKEWGDKIQAQKDSIALMERELDVLQRENKLRAASYYGDAGTRLRDEKKYAEDDRKYHDQIDAKQKAIDDAKSNLEQMKDDARKAGASPGAIG